MQNNGVHIYSVFDGELHKVKIDDVNFTYVAVRKTDNGKKVLPRSQKRMRTQ